MTEEFRGGHEQLPTELPGEWLDMTGKKIVVRDGHSEPLNSAKEFTIPAGHADKVKLTGKYNYYEGTMIVGAPDGSMRATPYSPEKEVPLQKAGYKRTSAMVPSLLGHQRFEDEDIQKQFEALQS